jgi:uncharacterized protein (DUF1697 family)
MAAARSKLTTYLVLFRGINVGGKNKVPMAELKALLTELGFQDVRTYIQSGNAIVSTRLRQAALEKLVRDVIAREFGGDIAVLARPLDYFEAALARNPFRKADPGKMYYTLLAQAPPQQLLADFLAPGHAPDRIEVIDDMAYVLCATKYSDLKINNNFIERKLKLAATTRVHNTITKLVELGHS